MSATPRPRTRVLTHFDTRTTQSAASRARKHHSPPTCVEPRDGSRQVASISTESCPRDGRETPEIDAQEPGHRLPDKLLAAPGKETTRISMPPRTYPVPRCIYYRRPTFSALYARQKITTELLPRCVASSTLPFAPPLQRSSNHSSRTRRRDEEWADSWSRGRIEYGLRSTSQGTRRSAPVVKYCMSRAGLLARC